MRHPSLSLVDRLLTLQEKVVNYYVTSITYLTKEIPRLLHIKQELIYDTPLPRINEIESKQDLISQFSRRISNTDDLGQGIQLYNKLGDNLKDDLEEIFHSINQIGKTLGDSTIGCQFFNLFFVNKQLQNTVKCILDNVSINEDTEKSYDQILKGLSNYTDMDDDLLRCNIEFTQTIIDTYLKVYSLDNPAEVTCFRLSIMKEISFDPKLKEEYEFNCENKILRTILNNEVDYSPDSFDDDECKLLDLMEIVTFHLDTIGRIEGLIDTLVLTATVKLKYLNYTSDLVNLTNLSKFESNFNVFKSRVSELVPELISKGTKGLSQAFNVESVMNILKDFEIIVKTIVLLLKQLSVNTDRITSRKMHMLKEELHFSEALNSYLNLLIEFNNFTSLNSYHIIIDQKKPEYEALDSKLKDQFFDLIYFNQRFNYELQIIQQLKKQ